MDKCRRRWDLADSESLKYKWLLAFDRAMCHLDKVEGGQGVGEWGGVFGACGVAWSLAWPWPLQHAECVVGMAPLRRSPGCGTAVWAWWVGLMRS